MLKKLLLSFIVATCAAISYANSPIIAQLDNYVYLTQDFRKALCDLHGYAPDHAWSQNFKKYCTAATENKFLAPFEPTVQVVAECLALDDGSCCDIQLKEVFTAIDQYRSELESGDAYVEFEEGFSDDAQIRAHCKVFCKLIVTQCLVVNGVNILDCCLNSVTNGANIGGGAEVFADKTGTTLEFRTLVAGTNITLTQMASTITIAATGTGLGDVVGTNTAICSDAVARFASAGSNSINNAPLRALDLNNAVQATSPLLADDCVTTNIDLALVPKGTGALVATVPDGTFAGGNARGNNAVDLQMVRVTATQVASGPYSVIAGGYSNTASGNQSTVGGGLSNTVSGNGSIIGGGYLNIASASSSTIGGGFSNTASNNFATIGGGLSNTVSGPLSAIPGGQLNLAAGEFSFAAGQQAQALHQGAFVWNDSTTSPVFTSSAVDQVRFHASGGFQIFTTAAGAAGPGADLLPGATAWTATSDRNRKTNFKDVDGVEILNKLMEVPIQSWNYKHQDASIRHMGPMAQDFNPAFGFTESSLGISTLDFDGVALAAIQGLYKVVKENQERITLLEHKNNQQELVIKQLVQEKRN